VAGTCWRRLAPGFLGRPSHEGPKEEVGTARNAHEAGENGDTHDAKNEQRIAEPWPRGRDDDGVPREEKHSPEQEGAPRSE